MQVGYTYRPHIQISPHHFPQLPVDNLKNVKFKHCNSDFVRKRSLNSLKFWVLGHFDLIKHRVDIGGRQNRPLSNISTRLYLYKLSYHNVINKYLDQGTAQWIGLIAEDKWEERDRNDTLVEVNKTNAIRDANDRPLANTQTICDSSN